MLLFAELKILKHIEVEMNDAFGFIARVREAYLRRGSARRREAGR